jgi:hypothetical protein
MELVLHVGSDAEGFERQAWSLTCDDLRTCRLGADFIGNVQRLTDHVLLAPYRDPHVVLGMKGCARDPRRAVADLWEQHRRLADGWIPFEAYFNPNLPLAELLESTAAIFAEGPSRLVEAYREVLTDHGIEPYVVREGPPKRWTGTEWAPERGDAELLLLPPHDYLIGAGFNARRVSLQSLPTGA